MKSPCLLSVGLTMLLLQAVSAQTTIYQQNFNSYTNGTSADSWYGYAGGGGTSTPNSAFVTNYLGSQVYQVTWDSTLDSASYQYAGIGGGNGGSGTIPAPNFLLSQITLSISLAEHGSTSPNAFILYLDQYGTPVVAGHTYSWQEQFVPTTTTDGSFTTFITTLDLGAGQVGAFNPALPIALAIDNNSGYAFAAGNQMIIDNVLVTAVPEPATLALLGLGAVGVLALRRPRPDSFRF